jgi:hypothetical protein
MQGVEAGISSLDIPHDPLASYTQQIVIALRDPG